MEQILRKITFSVILRKKGYCYRKSKKKLRESSTTAQKQKFFDAAAAAVYNNFQPISWTSEKSGILSFAEAGFQADQCMPVTENVDVCDFLPSSTAIHPSLTRLAMEQRKKDSNDLLMTAMAIGGGVSCDGLNQKNSGKKYYDLTLHFSHTKALRRAHESYDHACRAQRRKLICFRTA